MTTAIPTREYQRRYDVIAAFHLNHHLEHGANPWMTHEPELREWTVAHVQRWVPAGARVLDAGCGIGLMLADLAASYDAVGVDIADTYLAHATAQGLDARHGWVEALPFPSGSFDAAVCSDVLEHLRDPDKAIAELRRVVVPGGVLVARVPDGDATGVGADSGFGFPVHLQSFDTDQLSRLVGGELLEASEMLSEIVLAIRLP